MTRNSKFIFILIIIWAVGSIFVFAGLRDYAPASGDNPVSMANKAAPDFELELLSGKKIKLSDFRGKKPVIVNFWASWCGPCRSEAPFLSRVGSEYEDKVEFIGIAVNDGRNEAKAFLKEFDINYDNGMDITGGINKSYKITGIPETFFIDLNGEIIDHWIGPIDEKTMIDRINKII